MAIDAVIWRDENRQKQAISIAWLTASLSRAKRMPSIKQLLSMKPARPLRGAELEKRRQEFNEAGKGFDIAAHFKKLKENRRE